MKFGRRKNELSVRARQRGILWFVSALFHSISQTSFVFVAMFLGLLWGVNSLTSYLGPGQAFEVSDVILLPLNDPDIEQLKPVISIKKGDTCTIDKFNALETQLLSYGWIKDIKHKLTRKRQLEILITKKIPFAKIHFIGSQQSSLDDSTLFIDSELDPYEPGSTEMLLRASNIPMVQYDGSVPAGADSKSLPAELKAMANFLKEYYKSEISSSYRIKNSMVSDQTYFIEFEQDIHMNLINPEPASLVPHVETILRRLPLDQLRQNSIFIKNSRDVLMKKRAPLELQNLF